MTGEVQFLKGETMKKAILTAVSIIAVTSLAGAASAQFPKIPKVGIPGLGGSSSASYDPDAFVSETVETTKLMMISAALLAAAADAKSDADAVRARITAIEGMNEVGELKAEKAAFNKDVAAVQANAGDAAAADALYERSDARKRKLLGDAGYNFSLAILRNAILAGQAPDLVRNVSSNPSMLSKVGSIKTAGDMVIQQAKAVGSMAGPMQTLMSRGGVKPPADAKSSKPRPASI